MRCGIAHGGSWVLYRSRYDSASVGTCLFTLYAVQGWQGGFSFLRFHIRRYRYQQRTRGAYRHNVDLSVGDRHTPKFHQGDHCLYYRERGNWILGALGGDKIRNDINQLDRLL